MTLPQTREGWTAYFADTLPSERVSRAIDCLLSVQRGSLTSDDVRDAARWRVIEYLLLGDEPHDDAPDFHTMIAELAYSHQIDIGIISGKTPSTLELIDQLVDGYARGAEESP